MNQESLEKTDLDGHPWIREPLWKSGIPIEKLQYKKKKKKSEIGCPGKSKRNKLTLYTSCPSHCKATRYHEDLLSCDFSLRDGVVVIRGYQG